MQYSIIYFSYFISFFVLIIILIFFEIYSSIKIKKLKESLKKEEEKTHMLEYKVWKEICEIDNILKEFIDSYKEK